MIRGLGVGPRQRPQPRAPTAHARNNIRAAVGLLAWLRGRGTKLASSGQADIDEWLGTGPSAGVARDFLAWAASRGHCQRLTISIPTRTTGPAVSQDQRWALSARLLHDTALDLTDRVARRLLAAALRTPAVPYRRHDHQPGHPTRQLRPHRARPPRRARARPARHRHPPAHQRWPQLSRHRVPGRHHLAISRAPAGRPIAPASLGERLRTLGIYAKTGRRAALLDLAAQLPAAAPTSSACTRRLRPSECIKPEVTGLATQPNWPALVLITPGEYVRTAGTSLTAFSAVPLPTSFQAGYPPKMLQEILGTPALPRPSTCTAPVSRRDGPLRRTPRWRCGDGRCGQNAAR